MRLLSVVKTHNIDEFLLRDCCARGADSRRSCQCCDLTQKVWVCLVGTLTTNVKQLQVPPTVAADCRRRLSPPPTVAAADCRRRRLLSSPLTVAADCRRRLSFRTDRFTAPHWQTFWTINGGRSAFRRTSRSSNSLEEWGLMDRRQVCPLVRPMYIYTVMAYIVRPPAQPPAHARWAAARARMPDTHAGARRAFWRAL